MKKVDNENHESLLVDVKGVANLVGLSKNTVMLHNSSGRLGPISIKLGRRRLWRRKEIEQWIDAGCPARHRWQSRRPK